jgi:hypothetical protein
MGFQIIPFSEFVAAFVSYFDSHLTNLHSNQYVHRSLDVEGELSAPRAAPRCLQRHLALLEL